ncbi:MAG: RNA methyltransferase [Selenomonadaceae bacterium]|nr:RNA methyltransferase [Selenomonadaceae bacterium]MBR1859879.1 RNA methyltransferase [Selenomonadaceae bacterium]
MNKLKLINKLKLRKYRDEYGLFTVEGDKLINEVPKHLIEFIVTQEEIGEQNFKKFSSLTTPQSAIAVCNKPKSSAISENFIIVLDKIQDPNNVGAILRTTAAANFHDVILIDGTADPFNPKSIRASMGAIFHLNLINMSEDDLLNSKFNLVAAHINGIDYKKFNKPEHCALILGNEGAGVSKNLREAATKITIPISNVESLNVNAAAAILIFHFT